MSLKYEPASEPLHISAGQDHQERLSRDPSAPQLPPPPLRPPAIEKEDLY